MTKLKLLRPITPSSRGTILLKRENGSNKPLKKLTIGKKNKSGRNNDGRITSWSRGGGHKIRYRKIAFQRTKFDIPAKVISIEYDPNRTADIALLEYSDGYNEYIISPEDLKIGSTLVMSRNIEKVSISSGNSLPLSEIPIGMNVYCIELKPGGGAKLARSAGSYAVISGKEGGRVMLRMPSSEVRTVEEDCMAIIGIASNIQLKNTKIGKAGRNRWKGRRPNVRGEAMNPVDHPLGGRTRGNRIPCSAWGQCAKGLKTRRNKLTNKFIITRRKKK